MAAAVVELNALADAIRTATENHDFGPRVRVGLILFFIRGVHVRREGFEFSGASVDALEHWRNAVASALQTHGSWRCLPNLREVFVAGAVALGFAKQIFGCGL